MEALAKAPPVKRFSRSRMPAGALMAVGHIGDDHRIDPRQHDVCTQTIDQDDSKGIENPGPQVLNLPDILYGFNKLFHQLSIQSDFLHSSLLCLNGFNG